MHLIKGAFRTKSLALPAGCKTGFAEVVRSEAGDEICLGGCQVEKMEEAFQVREHTERHSIALKYVSLYYG